MLRINQIKCRISDGKNEIIKKMCNTYKIDPAQIKSFEIVRQGIDARKKPEIFYTYSANVSFKDMTLEKKMLKKYDAAHVSLESNQPYVFPNEGKIPMKNRPVVVGMGPAGLFCGYYLAKAGFSPIIIERGKRVEERSKDVETFWKEGVLNPDSNVQFGEGGAGTFSDGKLNTLVKDRFGRNKEVLSLLVKFGAPEPIVYQAKPHIGTDVLAKVVKGIREEIIQLGGEVLFETKMEEIITEDGHITGIKLAEGKEIATSHLVLATGHSARDTFFMLHEKKVPMQAKSFAVGFRVVHPQKAINLDQYGVEEPGELGAAAYKVTAQTSVGRGVYSFCMCPGGYVVNASSEPEKTAVNGMSYSGRKGDWANSAIIVSVTPEDYPGEGPLAGIAFQREMERKAYELGKGMIPAQYYGDYKEAVLCMDDAFAGADEIMKNSLKQLKEEAGIESIPEEGEMVSEETAISFEEADRIGVKGSVRFTDLTGILKPDMNVAFVEGMEKFGSHLKGFSNKEALLLGVESRTSSPVRVDRDDESLESVIGGLYPCGEGAGYAGGITSAAMDGLRVAEKIVEKYMHPMKG